MGKNSKFYLDPNFLPFSHHLRYRQKIQEIESQAISNLENVFNIIHATGYKFSRRQNIKKSTMAIKDESLNSLCCKLDILEQTQSPPWYVHPPLDVGHWLLPKHSHCRWEEAEQDTFCQLDYHHHYSN